MIFKLIAFSTFVVLIAVLVNIYYSFNKNTTNIVNDVLFTKDELSKYNGVINKELYLSILGEVYDVSGGWEYYGAGQTYHVFVGKDSSRSFLSAGFDEQDASDDVLDLSYDEIKGLVHWRQFYQKKYIKKGVLIGRYFDDYGNPTQYSIALDEKLKEGENQEEKKNELNQLYPPCNVEWTPENGSRYWCTNRSGGIKRDWIGYPRKFYEPGASDYRCVCVENAMESYQLKHYDNCDIESDSCVVLEK